MFSILVSGIYTRSMEVLGIQGKRINNKMWWNNKVETAVNEKNNYEYIISGFIQNYKTDKMNLK